MCSTLHVPVTHVSTPSAHLEVTLDGVTLTRTKAKALQRGVAPRLELDWDQVLGAETSRTAQGRTILRLRVAGAPAGLPHREDPWAVKVPRGLGDAARDLAAQIEHEVATRRRWREGAAADEQPPAPAT